MLKHALIVSLLLSACASRDPGDSNSLADAGATGADGTVQPDSGNGADAGTTPDAAPIQPDAAQPQPDAGTQPDASPQPDAGTQPDAPPSDAPPADAPPVQATIACTVSGSVTTLTLTGPILAHVINNAGLTPNANWTIQYGYGGTDSAHWVSDTATYELAMPNETAGFNLVLREPNGVDHWFEVNGYNVTGTCSQGDSEFTHTASNGATDGTLACAESGSVTNVTLTGPILAHVFNNAGLTPSSSWTIRFGYGGSDTAHWVSDTASYQLTMPKATAGFNLVLRESNGTDHWFDINGFNVTGTCSQGNSEFSHIAR